MTDSEPELEEVTDRLTFVPAAMIRRLWTCPYPNCDDEFISPNALGEHATEEHSEDRQSDSQLCYRPEYDGPARCCTQASASFDAISEAL